MRHFIKPTVKLGVIGGAIYAAVHFGAPYLGGDDSAQAVMASAPATAVVATIVSAAQEVPAVLPVAKAVVSEAKVEETVATIDPVIESAPEFVEEKKAVVAKAPAKTQRRVVYYYMPPYHPGMLPPPPPPMPFF
ncbi:MAG TPA: hypothetical protein EYO58_10910 [Flavobacteriales bacterium]|nr:hypothetical protein [Flavobacteriales bacterium]